MSDPIPLIGQIIDAAMDLIEKENKSIKGVLPRNYGREGLDKGRLGQLVDLIGSIGFTETDDHGSDDVLGRVYEYFLGQFAGKETGKDAGAFYTPRSVVKTLVEMLEPYHGRVYDPACGSGGMFVQSAEFVKARRNVVVVADEAHRSQYGFSETLARDGTLKAGLAKHMRDALPGATFLGFTGTPIESTDKSTRAVFGDYIDVYDLTRAVEDGHHLVDPLDAEPALLLAWTVHCWDVSILGRTADHLLQC